MIQFTRKWFETGSKYFSPISKVDQLGDRYIFIKIVQHSKDKNDDITKWKWVWSTFNHFKNTLIHLEAITKLLWFNLSKNLKQFLWPLWKWIKLMNTYRSPTMCHVKNLPCSNKWIKMLIPSKFILTTWYCLQLTAYCKLMLIGHSKEWSKHSSLITTASSNKQLSLLWTASFQNCIKEIKF